MAESNLYGDIISKDSANQQFGAVTNSVSVESDQLRRYSDGTKNLIMFQIIKNELYILGDNRVPLFPASSSLDADTEFIVYSKTKFIELLDRGLNRKTFVELRDSKLTITNGDYTLEFGAACPPWCNSQ